LGGIDAACVCRWRQILRYEPAKEAVGRGEPLTRQVLDMVVDQKVIVEIKATERGGIGDHRGKSQSPSVCVRFISLCPFSIVVAWAARADY
jgi:hypothetical protein